MKHGFTLSQKDKFQTSKLKEFANDYLKFYGNGRKFPKMVENTVEKGEIAHYSRVYDVKVYFYAPVLKDRGRIVLP